MNPDVLYEDNHLLVVVKPRNMPIMADDSGDPDLQSGLKAWLKEKYDKPGNVFLGIVHRLDRPVGGVMVLAKTSKAASRLSAQIRDQETGKVYRAIVHGVLENTSGRLRDFLLKDDQTRNVSRVSQNTPGAKEALLDYEVVAHQPGMSMLRIRLQTGRPHQIRVQLAGLGHPIVGDARYGNNTEPGTSIALWCSIMEIDHPVTGARMRFVCDPPVIWPWSVFGTIRER